MAVLERENCKTMCMLLSINYQNVGNDTKTNKNLSFIKYFICVER